VAVWAGGSWSLNPQFGWGFFVSWSLFNLLFIIYIILILIISLLVWWGGYCLISIPTLFDLLLPPLFLFYAIS